MNKVALYTIGYGAREIEDLISTLKSFEIAFLIDIRSKPYSRYKPDFSKQTLAAHLKKNGIRYLFMGDSLGGLPSDLDCYTNGKVDYEKVCKKPFYLEGIGRLREAYKKNLRVALMCSEGKPEMCHRSKLIGKSLTEENINIIHIDEKDRPITQKDVMLRLTKGQPSLFGDDFLQFSSRKKYQPNAEDQGAE